MDMISEGLTIILTAWQSLQTYKLSPELVTLAFIIALNLYVAVEIGLNRLQISHIQAHRAIVPAQFATQVTEDEHHKAADYSLANLTLGRWILAFDAIVLLMFTQGGGFQRL